MNSMVAASSTSDQDRPEENLSSKPGSTTNVQKTPVSLLQELYVRQGITPKYDLVQIEGAVHEPTFKYRVTVGDAVATGNGKSKKKAKSEAAKAFLLQSYEKSIRKQDESFSELSLCRILEKTSIVDSNQPEKDTTSFSDSSVITNCLLETRKNNLKTNNSIKSPISELQEQLSSVNGSVPRYELIVEEGPPNDRLFYIRCLVGSKHSTQGVGKSKKIAKEEAAKKMISQLTGGNKLMGEQMTHGLKR